MAEVVRRKKYRHGPEEQKAGTRTLLAAAIAQPVTTVCAVN